MSPACEFQNGALCHNGAVTLGLGLQTGKRFSRFPTLLSFLNVFADMRTCSQALSQDLLAANTSFTYRAFPQAPRIHQPMNTVPHHLNRSPLAPPFSSSVLATRLKYPNLSKCSQHRRVSASHISVSPQKYGARQILDPLSMALCPTPRN